MLDGREHLRCPMLDGGGVNAPDGRICVWPGPIDFEAERERRAIRAERGGPCSRRAAAPRRSVRLAAGRYRRRPARRPSSSATAGPHLRLSPGMHRITGRLAWSRMPEAVRLPGSVSLVALTVNGVRVALPERAGDSLRLGAVREQAQVDQLDVQIYRKLTDAFPVCCHAAHVRMSPGVPREELVGPLLPADFAPMQTRGPLPARLQPDGRLRVQVRPGTWTLELTARSASALETIRRPDSGVAEEVWSFEAVDRLRASAVEGASSIDPDPGQRAGRLGASARLPSWPR